MFWIQSGSSCVCAADTQSAESVHKSGQGDARCETYVFYTKTYTDTLVNRRTGLNALHGKSLAALRLSIRVRSSSRLS